MVKKNNGNSSLLIKINPCPPHNRNPKDAIIKPIVFLLIFELLKKFWNSSFIAPKVSNNNRPINEGSK